MGDLVELNRKLDSLTATEVLGIAQREKFDEILVIGLHEGHGISVWTSDMLPERAHWLASKAEASLLRNS